MLKNEFATEKVASKQESKNDKSKENKIWNFSMSQRIRSYTAPPNTSPSQDATNDDDDEDQEANKNSPLKKSFLDPNNSSK